MDFVVVIRRARQARATTAAPASAARCGVRADPTAQYVHQACRAATTSAPRPPIISILRPAAVSMADRNRPQAWGDSAP